MATKPTFLKKLKNAGDKFEKFDNKMYEKYGGAFEGFGSAFEDDDSDPKTRKHKNCRTCRCH